MKEPKYQTQPEFILREIGNETVLVPVGVTGELENCMISLNETYGFLWKQFQEPCTVSKAIENARDRYEDPEGLMERQIREAVEEFVKRSVLKVVEE
ncbi:MAG: PqqD family protein [Lachnospiraceae bacterium]|nr:PqqD family protein [Lachnospiraceae bacterium]